MSASPADRLIARTDRVLRLWEERVRAEVAAARPLSSANLINTFPVFLERVAEALSDTHVRRNATEGSAVAEEHGAYRIRASGYRMEDVVREYQLLRDVIVEVLAEQRPLTERELQTITLSIDGAIRESIAAFVLLSSRERVRETSALAHDLRNPLVGARAAAEVLAERHAGTDAGEWARRILENLQRADGMVQALLDAQLLQAGVRLPLSLERIELSSFVAEVVQASRAGAGERVRLIPSGELHGWWSRDALRRILENLIGNALKFAPERAPVSVKLRQDLGRVSLVVHSEGSYIPAEQRETLFHLFGRTGAPARGKSGWGLGLAIVRGLAESMGGTILIESAPGAGTTFMVDLPLDARPFDQVVPSLPPAGPSSSDD